MATTVPKNVLDKGFSDEELDGMGISGDPDDWSSADWLKLSDLYSQQHPEEVEPTRPDYKPIYDPNTQSLLPQAQKWLDAIQMDNRGLDKFRQEALRTGPSAWAQLATARQNAEESQAREGSYRKAGAQAASARSSLARSGGLDSGARERLARGSMRDTLDMQQDVARQGSLNRIQIGENDEQNRIQQLGMLPGMEVAAIQPAMDKARMLGQASQFDITNQMKGTGYENEWNMQKYKDDMDKWAANKQADATAASGK